MFFLQAGEYYAKLIMPNYVNVNVIVMFYKGGISFFSHSVKFKKYSDMDLFGNYRSFWFCAVTSVIRLLILGEINYEKLSSE